MVWYQMKFALPYGFFIFALNKFPSEKSLKNISESLIGHCYADSFIMDIIAGYLRSEFYHPSNYTSPLKKPEYYSRNQTY